MRSMTGMSSNPAMLQAPQRSRRRLARGRQGRRDGAVDHRPRHRRRAPEGGAGDAGRPRRRRRSSCPARSGRASTGWSTALAEAARRLGRSTARRGHHDRRAGRPVPRPRRPASPGWSRDAGRGLPGAAAGSGPGGAASWPGRGAGPSRPTIASANWLASAGLVARRVGRRPVRRPRQHHHRHPRPAPAARCAPRAPPTAQRLASGELVYTGLTRTPLMALAAEAPFAGQRVVA